MFYIYATRRDDLTKYYWNRRKNEWQTGLAWPSHHGRHPTIDHLAMALH